MDNLVKAAKLNELEAMESDALVLNAALMNTLDAFAGGRKRIMAKFFKALQKAKRRIETGSKARKQAVTPEAWSLILSMLPKFDHQKGE